MAVAIDAVGTETTGLSTTSVSYTGLTVGSSLTNSVLLCPVNIFWSGSQPTVTAVWDSGGTNQSMTLLDTQVDGPNLIMLAMFGLVAPVSGNKTLLVTATNNCQLLCVVGISFTGAAQTTGTAFVNFNHSSGTGTTASTTVSSTASSYVVGQVQSAMSILNSLSDTTIYNTGTNDCGANYAVGTSSKTLTATYSASTAWDYQGVSVAPFVPVVGVPRRRIVYRQ